MADGIAPYSSIHSRASGRGSTSRRFREETLATSDTGNESRHTARDTGSARGGDSARGTDHDDVDQRRDAEAISILVRLPDA